MGNLPMTNIYSTVCLNERATMNSKQLYDSPFMVLVIKFLLH